MNRSRYVSVTNGMLFSPSLESQASSLGGKCEYLWSPGQPDPDVIVNNTGLARLGGHTIVAQRCLQNRNGTVTVNWRENPSTVILRSRAGIHGDWRTLGTISLLDADPPLSIEDARIISFTERSKLLLAAVWHFNQASTTGPDRAVTSQAVIELDHDYTISSINFPNIGGNRLPGHYEKNWMPISDSDYFTYSLNGKHSVFKLNGRQRYQSTGIAWAYGDIHGGSQWVHHDSVLLGFFHSSISVKASEINGLPTKGKYYFVGAVQANPQPPHNIIAFTPTPILWSSVRNPRVLNGPISLFVNGLATYGDWVEISMGVNDAASALVRFPYESLRRHLRNIPQ